MANFTFFGQFGGITRQCALCQELLVVNAPSSEVGAADAHHLWSSAFERHIKERHATGRAAIELESCPTRRLFI